MCEIHETKHSIYRKECLGKQDRGVGVSFVRNLEKGRSKWSASQASLNLIETRLRGSFGKGFLEARFLVGLAQTQYYTKYTLF